jgi:hypothetical protein
MTTSQFLKIRSALTTASILADASRTKAKSVQETRHYRRWAETIAEGMRTLDSLEGERTDLPRKKQLALAEAAQ